MLFMNPYRSDQLLNVIGLFEDSRHWQDDPGWKVETARDEVLETFAGFHPKFKAVLAVLDERVLSGSAALFSDAAHTTLPTLAQGAAMATETSALKILFPASTTSADIPVRLAAYEELRKERALGKQKYLMGYDTIEETRRFFERNLDPLPRNTRNCFMEDNYY
ncbi:hypothetical protein B0H13DRAFT_1873202 [Mycena leptocephala]|nr:hypothetical protein B0H13DRAFT_1873202 [Mycena leptocephala]